jgi:hypothetical protein
MSRNRVRGNGVRSKRARGSGTGTHGGWRASAQARAHVLVAVECRTFEPGLQRLKELGLDFSAPIILVEQRQDPPALIAVSLELIVHRIQKSFWRANTARQGIQPHESSAFTPRARLRPAGRLCLSGHIEFLISGP